MNANDLATQHCQPRKGKEHALDATQVAGLLRPLPGWQLRDDGMAIVKDFKRAWEAKDVNALIGLLDPDVTVIADGGGIVAAALHPIEGREPAAHSLADLARRVPDSLTLLERTVNGQPGLVALHDGATVTVFAFHIADDRIKHIWAVRNPEKLQPWP